MTALKTIKLREPIIQDGLPPVTEIVLQKIKARHMRKFPVDTSKITFENILELVGSASGQPDHVIDELGIDDLQEIAETVAGFMNRGPKTGDTP